MDSFRDIKFDSDFLSFDLKQGEEKTSGFELVLTFRCGTTDIALQGCTASIYVSTIQLILVPENCTLPVETWSHTRETEFFEKQEIVYFKESEVQNTNKKGIQIKTPNIGASIENGS